MRVYRAEVIKRQIELLRTRQEDLDTNIARKKAGIAGLTTKAEALVEVIELMNDPFLAMELRASITSFQKQIILDEADVQGMLAEITALGSEIEKLESLSLSVKAEDGLEDALRTETAGKEQSDDV